MLQRAVRIAAVIAILLCIVFPASACSWAVGYFHQITCLKGKVVGKSLGPLQFRWLRQSFSVPGATLELYDYPATPWRNGAKPLARTIADSSGEFDFGSVPEGHYSLYIKGRDLEDLFDVEITRKARVTRKVILDISPHSPDCTGGHEFLVEDDKK